MITGVTVIQWRDFHSLAGIDAALILSATLYGNPRRPVEALANYLSKRVVRDLAERYVLEVRPLIAEYCDLESQETLDYFSDPRRVKKDRYFQKDTARGFSDHYFDWASQGLASKSEWYAFRAQIEFGLKCDIAALQNASLAKRFEANPDLDLRNCMDHQDPKSEPALIATERRKAELLAELLSERRRRP
jgi:hypothetical protein